MNKIFLSTIATLAIATSASAFMGINAEVGGGVWMPELSGNANIRGAGAIDFGSSNMDDKKASGNNYLYADFSHFVPIIPNVRVEKLDYNIDSTSGTKVDMQQTDIIAYWGVPLVGLATAGVLNLNFGLDAKNLKGTVDTSNASPINFNETLPLVYLNARVDLPFAPIDLEATTKAISYDGASISDSEAKISFTLPIPVPLIDFKIDVGYRAQNITIPDSLVGGLKADINTKGAFFGLSAKF
jgi:outer membrane protein